MKKRKNLISNKTKLFAENLLGIILGVWVGCFLIPSAIEDIGFYFFKKKSTAQVVSIVNGGTSEKPFIVKVKYIDEHEITDFILVDSIFKKRLVIGASEDVFYFNLLDKNAYFVNYQYPMANSVMVEFVSSILLLFMIYACSRNILKMGNVSDLVVIHKNSL